MQHCFILNTNLNYYIIFTFNVTNDNELIVLFKEDIIVEDNNID